MADYLDRLIQRTGGRASTIKPLIRSSFGTLPLQKQFSDQPGETFVRNRSMVRSAKSEIAKPAQTEKEVADGRNEVGEMAEPGRTSRTDEVRSPLAAKLSADVSIPKADGEIEKKWELSRAVDEKSASQKVEESSESAVGETHREIGNGPGRREGCHKFNPNIELVGRTSEQNFPATEPKHSGLHPHGRNMTLGDGTGSENGRISPPDANESIYPPTTEPDMVEHLTSGEVETLDVEPIKEIPEFRMSSLVSGLEHYPETQARAEGPVPLINRHSPDKSGSFPGSTIRVSIGRVEVRAVHQPESPKQVPQSVAAPRTPAITLDDYLKRRGEDHR